jgi:histidinol-phosphate/aromatic aminotransferase/cobyric acid decarboxylase-like protein
LNIANKRKYDVGYVIKVEKLVDATNRVKGMWQMNMYFEQYDMSITDGSRECPNVTNTEKALEDYRKNLLARKRTATCQPVANFVLTYSDAKNILDKFVNVYEQSSIQRLNESVDDGGLKASARSRNGHCRMCR